MIWEARLLFILFFFLCWCVIGLLPWIIAATVSRGRGALLALPLALTAASAAGVIVPAIGLRDSTGFVISLFTALLGGIAGSIGGIALYRRMQHAKPPRSKPAMSHAPGARRHDAEIAAHTPDAPRPPSRPSRPL